VDKGSRGYPIIFVQLILTSNPRITIHTIVSADSLINQCYTNLSSSGYQPSHSVSRVFNLFLYFVHVAASDPDIEHLPFFANTPEFFKSLYSSYYDRTLAFDFVTRTLISFQHYLFYVILSLARFNLYRLSYAHLISTIVSPKKRNPFPWHWWLEVVGLCVFYYWYTAVLGGIPNWSTRVAYVLITNIVPSPLHVQVSHRLYLFYPCLIIFQLVLSHYSRSTADLGPAESFAARQLRTTVDVICPPTLAFLHGGLHLQVTHHLFPRLPRHNLMEASLMVKEFAKEWDLEYAEFGFVRGNQDVRNVLREVADQAKIVGIVAEHHIQEAMKKST